MTNYKQSFGFSFSRDEWKQLGRFALRQNFCWMFVLVLTTSLLSVLDADAIKYTWQTVMSKGTVHGTVTLLAVYTGGLFIWTGTAFAFFGGRVFDGE